MRIRALETFCAGEVGITRVTADNGAEGWGQLSTYHPDISATVFHRQVAPWAVGADVPPPDGIGDLLDRVCEREHKFPGSHLCRALAGLDTALWDLHGRLRGQGVCELLGGSPRPLRVYASSMRRDIRPEKEAERFLRLRDRHGFDAFKFRVGSECGRDRDEWPGRSEAIVPAVRRALGDGADLLVDANSCYSPGRAIALGRVLEDNGVCHFEEPCPYWRPDWTRAVKDALDLDVAGGEQDNSLALWKFLIDSRTMDVAQPDVCYVGGADRFLRVARMAEAAGMPVTAHAANLSLVTVFTLHLMGAIPNAGPYVELSIEGPDYYPWQHGVHDWEPDVRDGRVAIPDRPGWGVDILPDWLARADRQVTEA